MLGVPKGHRRVSAAIDAGLRNGAIIEGNGTEWRAPGCATMEENVRSRLALMTAQEAAAIDGRGRTALTEYEATAGRLHPEQMAAVIEILARQFACLQGGAGVGKTHVTKAICAAWEATGGTVLLAALAGKAALKLSRSTGRLARTLFRTLMEVEERSAIEGKLASSEFSLEERTKLIARTATLAAITPDTMVLIDEASMVDLSTLHALLRHMPAGARLLLVGDDRQLPPISFGLIFHKLVHDAAVTSRLTVVHRQTDTSGIPAVATYLRNLTVPDLTAYSGIADGVSLLQAETPADIAEQVLRVRHDFADEDALILAPTNEGPSGVRELNRRLHDSHIERHGGLELRNALGDIFSLGEPLLHRRNDYARGLFNGSMGVVRSVNPSTGTLSGRFDGDEAMFGPAELADLSLGYAMTCHRAQGSQAARVIIALTRSRPLGPSWLYTAVTRAERQVVIVGCSHTLAVALERPWEAEQRRVGFVWPGSVKAAS